MEKSQSCCRGSPCGANFQQKYVSTPLFYVFKKMSNYPFKTYLNVLIRFKALQCVLIVSLVLLYKIPNEQECILK